jgi:uncharacterized membrane protein YkvA (DUF1232 family)
MRPYLAASLPRDLDWHFPPGCRKCRGGTTDVTYVTGTTDRNADVFFTVATPRKRVSRTAAFAVLWRVLRESQRPGAPTVRTRFTALPRLGRATLEGRYDGLGLGRLLLLLMATMYVLSPIDLMPEVLLPLLGGADDLAVLAWLAGALIGEADRFLDWESQTPTAHRSTVVPGEVVR